MRKRFQNYINQQDLFSPEDEILLAVSGGIDSVGMCYLFLEAGFRFGIAHCNFQLRGEDSDEDARFVEMLAKSLEVAFYTISFSTETYAKEHKVSIQMAARDLRYDWLEKIRTTHSYQYIATAHHLNDSIETILYNFSKGCGIRGLHGIAPKQGKIIRPLLFAKRLEIEDFITEQKITFREDASNASEKYSRNFIRHQVIPKLKSLNPAFENSVAETIHRIRETEWLFDQAVQKYRDQFTASIDEEFRIEYHKLPKEAASLILYEILKPMHFNGDQIKMILDQKHQSGIFFHSNTHTLLIDRDQLIIRPQVTVYNETHPIFKDTEMIAIERVKLHFKSLEKIPAHIPNDASTAFLDFEKLLFPLTLRSWKPGDIFQPMGMNGKHQKVKDYLIRKKVNRFEKSQVLVLESDDKICWVIGMRIDERFKISRDTKSCFEIRLDKKVN